jgi:hypothetical protein
MAFRRLLGSEAIEIQLKLSRELEGVLEEDSPEHLSVLEVQGEVLNEESLEDFIVHFFVNLWLVEVFFKLRQGFLEILDCFGSR